MTDAPREAPKDIVNTIKNWRSQARWLRFCHVTLLVLSSVFSILTAAEISRDARPWFAVGAAICVGILTALDLGIKANGFRNAWRHMTAAMARYHSIPEFTTEQLIRAYENAESLIGDLPAGPRPAVPQTTETSRDATTNELENSDRVTSYRRAQ